jgi:hypothetical protein
MRTLPSAWAPVLALSLLVGGAGCSAQPLPKAPATSLNALPDAWLLLSKARDAAVDLAREAESAADEADVTSASRHSQSASSDAAEMRDAIIAAGQAPGMSQDAEAAVRRAHMRANQVVSVLSPLSSTPAPAGHDFRAGWREVHDLARQISADLELALVSVGSSSLGTDIAVGVEVLTDRGDLPRLHRGVD